MLRGGWIQNRSISYIFENIRHLRMTGDENSIAGHPNADECFNLGALNLNSQQLYLYEIFDNSKTLFQFHSYLRTFADDR